MVGIRRMLVPRDEFDIAYRQIKEEAVGGSQVILFVAPDCDALCACRILTDLFKTDDVTHVIKPVSGYDDLARANEELVLNKEQVRSIVLLNCGGIIDIATFFHLSPHVTVYVVDAHRPFHLANLGGADGTTSNIRIFDDGDDHHPPTQEECIIAAEGSSDDSDDEEGEEEGEDGEEDTGEGEKKEAGADGDGTASLDSASSARKRGHDAVESVQRQRRTARRKVGAYYRFSSYGVPAAMLMYELAVQLNKSRNDLLWMAIVGLTDQFVHDRMEQHKYMLAVSTLREEVLRHNTEEPAEEITEEGTMIPIAEEGRIQFEMNELRFMLLRHWTLFESMYHSSHVAARLGIWREPGRRKLHQLFAKMGIPLAECQQKFSHMKEAIKRTLLEKLEEFSPEFGLEDISFRSFLKTLGFKFQVSAADVVHSVMATLECFRESDDEEGAYERNFWRAYDALASDNGEKIKGGLELSIELQRAIVRQGTSMIEKKSIVTSGPFRYAIMHDSPDLSLFTHPLSLSKLALFLIETFHESRREPKPFVLCSLVPRRGTYLAVGVTGTPDVHLNSFGTSFRRAAEQTDARVKHDGFETSAIEVQKEDIAKFLEALHGS